MVSAGVLGHWDCKSGAFGSIGMEQGFRSVKLYLARIESTYDSWEKEMVRVRRSRVTFIPSRNAIGPRSVNLYCDSTSRLNSAMSLLLLPVTAQSSTCDARIKMSAP